MTTTDQFSIRPANRNPRPDLINPIGATAAEYSAAHPFAPSGWGPSAALGDPTAGGPPASAAPSFASLSFGDQNRLANAGVTEPGSFAAQNGQANGTARVAGAPLAPAADSLFPLPASRTMAGPPPPNPEALAMARILPSAGPVPIGPGIDPNFASLAGSAAGLQDAQAQYAAGQTERQLARSGMVPSQTDSPEVAANKFAYLQQRLQTSLNGGAPRAPGSPTYSGKPLTGGKSDILSQWDATPTAQPGTQPGALTTDAAAGAYRKAQLLASRPPLPGSAGYQTVDIPGIGSLVRDRATGQPISQKDFAKTSDPKEKQMSDQELQQITALQQSKRDLDTIEAAYADLHDPNYGGPIGGRLDALVPGNPKVMRLQNLVTAATPNLARGVFRERGVLTDADVTRYQKLVPQLTDTAEQRAQKLSDLRSRLDASVKDTLSTLDSSGRDVTDLRNQIMGPQPAPIVAKLAPGSITPDQARAELTRRRGLTPKK